MITSYHILSNSLFTSHSSVRRYILLDIDTIIIECIYLFRFISMTEITLGRWQTKQYLQLTITLAEHGRAASSTYDSGLQTHFPRQLEVSSQLHCPVACRLWFLLPSLHRWNAVTKIEEHEFFPEFFVYSAGKVKLSL
jgi:hypothetical protein